MPASTATAGPLHEPVTYARGFPHARFAALREHDPVSHHDHPDFESGYWVVARHADVQRVSRDATTFHNAPHPFLEEPGQDQSATSGLLISLDAPDHVKQRKLINRGFTPRRVSDLTDALVARVNRIIDSLRERHECDLVHDLALWLPLHVIADLVGVPEDDREHVFQLTERTFGFDPAVTHEERAQAAVEMFAYADALCEERRRNPADDLISALVEAELDGEHLDQMQLDLFFMLLQNAGSETTRNLITSGTVALLQAPEQFDCLRADLSLLPIAIEELLRFTSPVMLFARTAMSDTEIAGQPVAAGARVVMAYPSANRDERAFTNPDTVDVARTPNEHVAFGAGGPHYCLGASLARLEATVMFEAIATRFCGLALEGEPADFPRLHSTIIDGFAEVPIHWQTIAQWLSRAAVGRVRAVLDGAKGFHVNVNCRNLERSRQFYEAIGLRAATRTAPDTVQPGDAFGLAQAQWDAWILAGANGFDAGVVDLLEWHTPAPVGVPPANLYTQGYQRVGLLVPDLDAAMRAVVAGGGAIWGEPKAHGEVQLVLGNDPDGVAIELVQAGGPTASFVGVACRDLERSVAWYRSIGFREAARFASVNDDSKHLRIDGASAFDEVMITAPGGGLSLILVGFTTPGVAEAAPRPANAVGIWRVALLVPDLDTVCRELDRLGIELLSRPVTMAMGAGLPELRFVCLRGPDHEVIELIEQPR